jgi:enediyne biosynthesis protein E4
MSSLIWGIVAVAALILLATLLKLNKNPALQNPPMHGTRPPLGTLAEIPSAEFKNITAEAGIHFVHQNGAVGEKLLPETMGGGCAFLDFDNDGDQDLLFVNSCFWPDRAPAGKAAPLPALYENDGRGHFKDVTAGSGLEVSFYAMGVAAGDYDNDGRVDIFLSGVGDRRLFHNDGNGKFRDVTQTAGVGAGPEDWSTSCAWLDYDRDGDLDLFLCQYVRWSRQVDLEVNYQLPGIGRAYGPPLNFTGSHPVLYKNNGSGQFTDVSRASGIQIHKPGTDLPLAKSLGVAPVDLDGDGWIDLIVANDTVQNFVFLNQRDGTFRETGARFGLAYDNYGGVRGAMGIDSCRLLDDSSLAVAIGNFANEMTALYLAQKDAKTEKDLFSDEAINQGIGAASRDFLTFGVFFFDFDLDGWLDLLTANGHIEESIAQIRPNQKYRQSAQLFWNSRGSRRGKGFTLVPPEKCGAELLEPIVGRGSAFADIDGDGDLDIVLTQIGGPPMLLRNGQKLNHHWLRLKLVGTQSNRDAIGAWVTVRSGGRSIARQVMPTRGYLSQSELPVTIGLGNASDVAEVLVQWPDGTTQRVESVPLDQLNRIEQPR